MKGRPIQLIRDGRVDWQVARRNHLRPRDLAEQLRIKGLKSVEDVEEAYLERNGAISVIKASD